MCLGPIPSAAAAASVFFIPLSSHTARKSAADPPGRSALNVSASPSVGESTTFISASHAPISLATSLECDAGAVEAPEPSPNTGRSLSVVLMA